MPAPVLTAADQKVADTLKGIEAPVYVVWNKNDLLSSDSKLPELPEFNKLFRVSAQTGQGLPELLAEVVAGLSIGPAFLSTGPTDGSPGTLYCG